MSCPPRSSSLASSARRTLAVLTLAGLALAVVGLACTSDPPRTPPPPTSTPDAGPPDPCASVTCDAAIGLVCSAADGLCHCGGVDGPVCTATEVCRAARALCVEPLAPICTAGTRWQQGMTAFRDVTADVGLVDLAVEGTRLASADLDGDGWAELFVRRGGNGGDDFAPGGVRQSWLLKNERGTAFTDVTRDSNVRATRLDQGPDRGRPGEVVAFADVDGDGDLDVYTGMSTRVTGALAGETSELLLNDGTGRFTLGPEDGALRRASDADSPAGASFVDYDRDGFVDLWIAEAAYTDATTGETIFLQDRLWRGDGTGHFTDETLASGLETEDWIDVGVLNEGRAHSRAWSSAACDLDGDGTTELLAASYGRAPNHLWQGRRVATGTVGFENRSIASGYAFDDNQTWGDNEFAKCFCQSNRSAEGCADVPRPRISCSANWSHGVDREPFRLGGNSGTTVCADVNNDGHLDLLTTEITHWWAGQSADRSELLLNTGEPDVRLTRPGNAATGLARPTPSSSWDYGDMTAAIFDFDNDGYKDVYVGASDYAGNHGLLFHQLFDAAFESVPIEQGIDHHRSHGVTVADFDRDGDLDVVVGHSRARCDPESPDDCYPTAQVRYFENTFGQDGNWLQLDLRGGDGVNGAAIGARVTVRTSDLLQVQEVGGGHGHYGIQHDLVQHFGLGASCEAEVTVRWPDAALTTETFTLPAGYRFRLRPGAEPELVPR